MSALRKSTAMAHPHRVRALIIVDVSPEIESKGVEGIRHFIQASDALDSCEAFWSPTFAGVTIPGVFKQAAKLPRRISTLLVSFFSL